MSCALPLYVAICECECALQDVTVGVFLFRTATVELCCILLGAMQLSSTERSTPEFKLALSPSAYLYVCAAANFQHLSLTHPACLAGVVSNKLPAVVTQSVCLPCRVRFSSKLPAVVTQLVCLPAGVFSSKLSAVMSPPLLPNNRGNMFLALGCTQKSSTNTPTAIFLTSSSCHSVSLLACRCVQLEAEKASKERTLLTVLTQFQEQGATLAISQEVEGELRAQLHTLTENCASLEAQVLSVAKGSAALQARCAALEVQAAQVKFRFG